MNKIYLDMLYKSEMQLTEAREKAHRALDELKRYCMDAKLPIKQNYFVDSWSRFGLSDKR